MLTIEEFSKQARKFYEKQDKTLQERIKKKIQELSENPRPPESRPVKGGRKQDDSPPVYRVRVGAFRIQYYFTDKFLTIVGINSRGFDYRPHSR